jgi:hypothetical protein
LDPSKGISRDTNDYSKGTRHVSSTTLATHRLGYNSVRILVANESRRGKRSNIFHGRVVDKNILDLELPIAIKDGVIGCESLCKRCEDLCHKLSTCFTVAR